MERNNSKWGRGAFVAAGFLLAMACAVEGKTEATPPAWLCAQSSGPQTELIEDVMAADEFADPAQARTYYEAIIDETKYSRTMHQKSLDRLLEDPRWAHPDQRDDLGVAVKQTVEMINGLDWREEYAAGQLLSLLPRS